MERLGEWKHRARIDVKYLKLHLVAILLEIINNQMNFLLNYAQISLITVPYFLFTRAGASLTLTGHPLPIKF